MKLTINDNDELIDDKGQVIGPVFDSIANRQDISISDIQRAYTERIASLKASAVELASIKAIVAKAAKETDPAKLAKHLSDANKPERERNKAEKQAQIAKLQAEIATL